jgi:SAM-dependent methyltransferase
MGVWGETTGKGLGRQREALSEKTTREDPVEFLNWDEEQGPVCDWTTGRCTVDVKGPTETRAAPREAETLPDRGNEPMRRAGPGRWLPPAIPLRLLEIGCGTAEDAGAWVAWGVGEYVGVDLDETAVLQARARWPDLTFLCEDAARLLPEAVGQFDAVLIRRPDLLVRPTNWRRVFAALRGLLRPRGRVLLAGLGKGEAALARRWLAESGLRVIGEAQASDGEVYNLVAEMTHAAPIEKGGDSHVDG